jgi:YVTN family beta-propeller protein
MLAASLAFSGFAYSTAVEAPLGGAQSPAVQKLVRDGVAIEFRVTPDESVGVVKEGDFVDVEFRISDAESGAPVQGIYPAVWMDIAKPWDQPDKEDARSCGERVQVFMQGIVGVRPMVDLNSYFVLALNNDATISVIDPIVGITGITKLYASINLPGPGAEWAKTLDEKRMFVSIPGKNLVAIVDLTTFKVVDTIDAGHLPVRLALQPDEKYLWVANNGDPDGGNSGVTVIDIVAGKKVGFMPTGKGQHHELAFSGDSRFAYVSNRNEGTITVFDTAKLDQIAEIDLGEQVIGIAYSNESEALYASNGRLGQISVIDGSSHEVVKRIEVKPGVGPVGVSQQGRWVVAANSHEDEVYAIDVATNEIKHTLAVERKPYQVAFSRHFVYVRSMGSERVSMFEINHLNTMDKVPVSSFAAGNHAPGKTSDLSLASAITQAPGEAAVLVTSPSDKTVYYYMEGMNAPMGNFRNYGHSPRAVSVANRTLREEEGGVYTAKVRVPAAGTYDVAFVMESPSILHCFEMAAERDPTMHLDEAAGLEFIDITRKVTVDDDVTVKFRLTDPATGDSLIGLEDVRVHYYRAPSFDRRVVAATEIGDGVYKLDTKLPKPGVYYFFVGSKSARLNMNDATFLSLQATRASATN